MDQNPMPASWNIGSFHPNNRQYTAQQSTMVSEIYMFVLIYHNCNSNDQTHLSQEWACLQDTLPQNLDSRVSHLVYFQRTISDA